MPNKLFFATVNLAVALGGPMLAPALAQVSKPSCSQTSAANAPAATNRTTPSNTMAATSDGGITGTGASSASIATGPIDKTGVNNPCVPGMSGRVPGAVPASKPSTP